MSESTARGGLHRFCILLSFALSSKNLDLYVPLVGQWLVSDIID